MKRQSIFLAAVTAVMVLLAQWVHGIGGEPIATALMWSMAAFSGALTAAPWDQPRS